MPQNENNEERFEDFMIQYTFFLTDTTTTRIKHKHIKNTTMLIPSQFSQVATTSVTSYSSFTTGASAAAAFVNNPQSILNYPTYKDSSSSSTLLKMVDPTVVSSVPGWVKLCSNLAPLASMAVLTAVSLI
jgi:hypothetical protein